MAGYGLGPRHLKQFHTAVVRAAGLIDGVVAPAAALAQRRPPRGRPRRPRHARAPLRRPDRADPGARGGRGGLRLMHAVVTGAGTGIGQRDRRAAGAGTARRCRCMARDARPAGDGGGADRRGGAGLRHPRPRAGRRGVRRRGRRARADQRAGRERRHRRGERRRARTIASSDLVATNLVGTYRCLRAAQRHLAPATGAAPPGRDRVDPGAHRGARATPATARPRPGCSGLVRSLAAELGARRRAGERDLPGLGRHDDGVDRHRRAWRPPTASRARRRTTRAMSEVPLRRMSQPADIAGRRRVAAVARRAGRDGPGDRRQRRRLHVLTGRGRYPCAPMVDLRTLIRDVPGFPKPGHRLQGHHAAGAPTRRRSGRPSAELADVRAAAGARHHPRRRGARVHLRRRRSRTSSGIGFAAARKPGKLPYETIRATYALEYGTDALELHRDAISPGTRVLIHDDLLATGGTAKAKVDLVEQLGGIPSARRS